MVEEELEVMVEEEHLDSLGKLAQLSASSPGEIASGRVIFNREKKTHIVRSRKRGAALYLRTMGVSSWQRFLKSTRSSDLTGAETRG